jgi:hypothetical protein
MKPEHKSALTYGGTALLLGGGLALAAANPLYWVIVGAAAYKAGKQAYQRSLLEQTKSQPWKDEDLFI